MTASSTLREAERRGMRIAWRDGELRVRDPQRRMTEALQTALRRHRDAIRVLVQPHGDHTAAPHRGEPTDRQRESLRVSDADLLALLAKVDAVDRAMAAAPRRGCEACGREDWYEDSHPSHRVCRHCHPPYRSPRPVPAPTVQAAALVMPEPVPGAWACPRGHGSDPSSWRRWGCGACRLQAEAVS